MRGRLSVLTALTLAFSASGTLAQHTNPSAEQIIQSLTPTGTLSKDQRGIRPVAPTSDDSLSRAVSRNATEKVTDTVAVAVAKPAMRAVTTPAPEVALTVNFANGSAELTPQAKETLDALGTALSSDTLASYRFRIEGHTDTVGSPQSNLVLSQRRAEAVTNYISTKFGVAASRMEAVGMGQEKPLISTAAQVPEPRNRRVQVINMGVGS